jgi:hypothetical protein
VKPAMRQSRPIRLACEESNKFNESFTSFACYRDSVVPVNSVLRLRRSARDARQYSVWLKLGENWRHEHDSGRSKCGARRHEALRGNAVAFQRTFQAAPPPGSPALNCVMSYTRRSGHGFLAQSGPDYDFASHLAEISWKPGAILPATSTTADRQEPRLISKAEEGLCANVLVRLLSPSSSPTRWIRERWEPVQFDQAKQGGVDAVTTLLRECSFPPLLPRRNLMDATTNPLTARRLLKRWFRLRERESGSAPSSAFSGDLEDLYLALADRPARCMSVA